MTAIKNLLASTLIYGCFYLAFYLAQFGGYAGLGNLVATAATLLMILMVIIFIGIVWLEASGDATKLADQMKLKPLPSYAWYRFNSTLSFTAAIVLTITFLYYDWVWSGIMFLILLACALKLRSFMRKYIYNDRCGCESQTKTEA